MDRDGSPRWRFCSWLAAALILAAGAPASASPRAVAGRLELSGFEAPIVLAGEWGFYAGRLLRPAEVLAANGPPPPTHLVQVPSYWNELPSSAGGRLGGMGYGSYLLELRDLRSPGDELGIYLRVACTAYRLYHFGSPGPAPDAPVLASGHVASDAAAAVPGHQPRLAPLQELGARQFVLVHVSNYDHSGGGLCAPPVVDRIAALEHGYAVKRVLDAAIVGMLLALAVWNLSLYRQRREDRASLWLAILAGVMLARTLSTEAFFELLYGESARWLFELSYKTEYLTLALAGVGLAHFYYYSFPDRVGRGILHYTRWPGTLLVISVLVTPVARYSSWVLVFLVWMALGILYAGAQLVRAWRAGVRDAGLACVGSLPVFAAGLFDMAVAVTLIDSIYFTPYAVILFIYTQGLIIAKRFSDALTTAQSLGRGLQAEVDRQTAELRERTAELEAVQEQLSALSVTDALTGIPNRLYFDRRFGEEWRRAQREARPLALLMIDVDHFKRINDEHGHVAGDDCLKAVARELSALPQRPGDFAARYGGEEFVLVMPGTPEEGALRMAERGRARIEALDCRYAGRRVPLTVSVGVAAARPHDSDSPTRLVSAADAALYRAKDQGRNCSVAASAGEAAP